MVAVLLKDEADVDAVARDLTERLKQAGRPAVIRT